MNIVEFLLARIAEDESIGQDWKLNRGKVEVHGGGTGYLALASPERVLAECTAKRAIVAEHQEEAGYVVVFRESDRLIAEGFDMDSVPLQASAAVIPRCLRHMAVVYADHPDYRQEWKL